MTISATHYGEPYDVYSRQRTRWKSNSSPPLRRHYRMYGIKCKRSSTSDLEYLWKLKVHIQKRPKKIWKSSFGFYLCSLEVDEGDWVSCSACCSFSLSPDFFSQPSISSMIRASGRSVSNMAHPPILWRVPVNHWLTGRVVAKVTTRFQFFRAALDFRTTLINISSLS